MIRENVKSRLEEYINSGFKFDEKDGALLYEAPENLVDEECINFLKGNKETILSLIHLKKGKTQAVCTPMQQDLWISNLLRPESAAFSIPVTILIEGDLDEKALVGSIYSLYQTNSILQVRFEEKEGKLFQIVDASRDFEVDVVELEERDIDGYVDQQVNKPFDMGRDVLFRSSLVRVSSKKNVLVFVFHHAIFDGWSQGIVAKKILQGYLGNAPFNEEISFLDFADSQKNNDFFEDIEYWKRTLEGAPVMLDLPVDFSRESAELSGNRKKIVPFSLDIVERVEAYCRANRITQSSLYLSVYKILLAKYSGQADLVVGIPCSGRIKKEYEAVIGCFVNNLAIRSTIDETNSFSGIVKQIHETSIQALDHQGAPFSLVVENVRPERVENRTPIFQTMFVYHGDMVPTVEIDGLKIQPLEWERKGGQYELAMSIENQSGVINGYFEYCPGLFSEATMDRLVSAYLHLLDRYLASPEVPLLETSLCEEVNFRNELEHINNTGKDFNSPDSIGEFIDRVSKTRSESIALSVKDDDYSYDFLHSKSDIFFQSFTQHKKGDLIAVCLPNDVYLALSMLAIFKGGLVYVPIDPTSHPARIEQIFSSVDISALIVSDELKALFDDVYNGRVINPAEIDLDSYAEVHCEKEIISREDAAYLVFTSGTTGKPKGVEVSHASLINMIQSQNEKESITENDSILQMASIGFDVFFEEVFGAWFSGARSVFTGDDLRGMGAKSLFQYVVDNNVTVINITTAYWHSIVQEMKSLNLTPPSSLRLVVFGGEAVQADKLRYWNKFEIPLLNLYGQTEACCDSTWYLHEKFDDTAIHPFPLGRPLHNTEVYVLDKYGMPVPFGSYGEIYIGGTGLANGYYKDLELTESKFVSAKFPFAAGIRLCKTGDRGRFNHKGLLEFGGRVDNQIKIRGFRVELGEIESCLLAHPVISEVALSVHSLDGDKYIVAYCVAQKGEVQLSSSELSAFVRGKLPNYCVPSGVFWLDQIPLNQNGKLDKRQLPKIEDDLCNREISEIVNPRNDTEQQLRDIWLQHLPVDEVSVLGDFFEYGGHSLMMSRILTLVLSEFGVSISLSQMMEATSIATQAELILEVQLNSISEEELQELLDMETA